MGSSPSWFIIFVMVLAWYYECYPPMLGVWVRDLEWTNSVNKYQTRVVKQWLILYCELVFCCSWNLNWVVSLCIMDFCGMSHPWHNLTHLIPLRVFSSRCISTDFTITSQNLGAMIRLKKSMGCVLKLKVHFRLWPSRILWFLLCNTDTTRTGLELLTASFLCKISSSSCHQFCCWCLISLHYLILWYFFRYEIALQLGAHGALCPGKEGIFLSCRPDVLVDNREETICCPGLLKPLPHSELFSLRNHLICSGTNTNIAHSVSTFNLKRQSVSNLEDNRWPLFCLCSLASSLRVSI